MIDRLKARWARLDSSRRLIVVAAIGLVVLIVWAAFAPLDDITRGQGKVIPNSKVQLVQAADPATVEEILVQNGEQVKRGQLLVRLNDSESASQLGQLETETARLSQRADRLQREASGSGTGCEPGSVCAEEQRLQQVRQAAARSRQQALAAAVEQRRRDLSEGQATAQSLESSLALAREQVRMLEPLAKQGIVPQTELITAQRDVVDMQGRLSAARQSVQRASAAVREAQADLSSARLDFQQQALNERSELATRIAVNEESIKGAAARVSRNELRAPVDGIVNDLQVTTVGGFVSPGEQIMQVVPTGDRLLVEAKIRPSDIAFIKVGDPANVKVTAFDFSIYGGLRGKVRQISADSVYDENERESYYLAQIETDRAFIAHGGQRLAIMPGMICEVEIITGRKSVLTYLLKPITRGLNTALTEK
ncbi:HlyD family type I secretion periplasmic adaptor subunit [Croceicoccus naphthovorans]|uniref:Membrane fusion protein (MFP) family protein n=1 Tax=Croceicoccus naphthovorans TaxID=1348774 RepID=A0A0G3XG71_9SPHN|nr:HlyD family type I secretion periplasmic adaptor subunit [Croceicoccus naphthovorans]AKM10192.1 secretion protein HlyD [Croceicoccus naphthovorans]MBB3990564.1 adhesin transport system membrane fusion protein [Croceicoccus naphthovorans]